MISDIAPAARIAAPASVLSVKEPWATLIVGGYKPIENRSWEFPASFLLPCRIAIHASQSESGIMKEWGVVDPKDDCNDSIDGWQAMTGLSRDSLRAMIRPGHIIGSVVVESCIDQYDMLEDADYPRPDHLPWLMDDGLCWVLRDARRYRQPIPAAGKLNLWKPDSGLAARIAAAEQLAIDCPYHEPLVIPWWEVRRQEWAAEFDASDDGDGCDDDEADCCEDDYEDEYDGEDDLD